jgi:hypothetical protein
MSKLYFKMNEIAQCVYDAQRARQDQLRPSFAEMFEAGVYDEELKPDLAKRLKLQRTIKPALHLVHDDGIYIMPNCWFDTTDEREGQPTIAYAIGCNPKTDGDIWDHCRDLVGGDDFCEMIPLDMVSPLLTDFRVTKLIVYLTEKQIRVGAVRKKRRPTDNS